MSHTAFEQLHNSFTVVLTLTSSFLQVPQNIHLLETLHEAQDYAAKKAAEMIEGMHTSAAMAAELQAAKYRIVSLEQWVRFKWHCSCIVNNTVH